MIYLMKFQKIKILEKNLSITNNLLNDFSTLEFKNVSFKYNNHKKFVINNLVLITKDKQLNLRKKCSVKQL